MKQYVTANDLRLINHALDKGDEVTIQLKGRDKVKIIAQSVKTLRTKEIATLKEA